MNNLVQALTKPALWIVLLGMGMAIFAHLNVAPNWLEQKTTYQVKQNDDGEYFYIQGGKHKSIENMVPYQESPLRQSALDLLDGQPSVQSQWVVETLQENNQTVEKISLLNAEFHFGLWSLLPALVAIALCLLTKEPLTSLFSGIVVGAFMLGQFDITDSVLIPSLATRNAAGILLLYLWLLGGLMGVWSKTGAAQAFSEYMSTNFVRGPRSAKLVAWGLGVLFFQGGTVSTVLVGASVKSVADKENVSHEELSYIVDSTAAPIASVIAFNAWPAYIQALIFIPGVSFLSTEADRLKFFFSSVPFSFYCILAVLGTLLLSLDITKFSGKGLRRARLRAINTGQLDAPGSKPMISKELHTSNVPAGYNPRVYEFFVPLLLLIGIVVGTYFYGGSPKVNWGFGAALVISVLVALFKGMSLAHVVEGFGEGIKGVVLASVILMLAITIGSINSQIGGGRYLIDSLGQWLPFWLLPVCLQLLTMIISFSTGTTWGTYAIAFPLAMPLAWSIAQSQGIGSPELFMSICFACVLNGSVYGDQCSPISDTTILSSTATGCDLMDHVKTQLVPASYAAAAAAVLWTLSALLVA